MAMTPEERRDGLLEMETMLLDQIATNAETRRLSEGVLREHQWLCRHPEVDSWYLRVLPDGAQQWVFAARASLFGSDALKEHPDFIWVHDREALSLCTLKAEKFLERIQMLLRQLDDEGSHETRPV